jgi:N-acyl amino acid synthase of PEP-CTERM/exosortase system
VTPGVTAKPQRKQFETIAVLMILLITLTTTRNDFQPKGLLQGFGPRIDWQLQAERERGGKMLSSTLTIPQCSCRTQAPTNALRSALELRYQVYCLECAYLAAADYPDGVESDEHDRQAAHFYAFDAEGELAGYVRLVRADGNQRFPMQTHCQLSVAAKDLPKHHQAAEISRLMVRNDYRRQRHGSREGATGSFDNTQAPAQRQESSQILLSLYRQMYAFSRSNGVRYWYAAMEKPLARSLLRMHFAFAPIGPVTDYYGPVAPYLADLRVIERDVGQHHPALLVWLQQPERWFGHTSHSHEWGLGPYVGTDDDDQWIASNCSRATSSSTGIPSSSARSSLLPASVPATT